MANQGQPQIDYTNKDYASLRDAMLQLAREKLPAWTDHSPNDLGIVLLELFAFLGDQLFYYQDRIANESYLETAVERRSVLHMLRLIGYELRPPTPASADLTLLFALDTPAPVTIETGAQFQTTAAATGTPVNFQYIREPLILDPAALPIITHTDRKSYRRFSTLPVVQVDTSVSGEIIGSSAGSAGQRFVLARVPLIDETLVVSVDEGVGPQAWERKATLLYSDSADAHYSVRRDENNVASIEFGDNRYGKIPRRGRNNIRADYRTGGGAKGNVPPNTIIKAVTKIKGLEVVFNEQAASAGADAEATAEAAQRGPQLFRTQGRAVTAEDYEVLARGFGVGKARARADGWNYIDLFVAPAGGGKPSDTLKEDLRAYFDDKRIVSSIVEIHDPVYISVYIKGQLEVEAFFFTEQIQQRVEEAVRGLLAFEQVDFEDRLYLSKVYEAIEKIEGVRGVNITHFTKTDPSSAPVGLDLPLDGTLRFDWNEIPIPAYPQGIRLDRVTGGRRAG
jgi:uncharacterized phage protein gp47/JayE